MFKLFSAGDRVDQYSFIKAARSIIENNKFDQLKNGFCSTICNLFIKTGGIHRTHLFNAISSRNNEDVKNVVLEILDELSTPSIVLDDRICLDAFVIIVGDKKDLIDKVQIIIDRLQECQQKRYIHITFGYLHSIVLEQNKVGNFYEYYIYDPNNNSKPTRLLSAEAIANEIYNALNLIYLGHLKFKYFMCRDSTLLLTFYVYPGLSDKEEDEFIHRVNQAVEKKINYYYLDNKLDCALYLMHKEGGENELNLLKQKNQDYYFLIQSEISGSYRLGYVEKGQNNAILVKEEINIHCLLKLGVALPIDENNKLVCLLTEMNFKQLSFLMVEWDFTHIPQHEKDLQLLREIKHQIDIIKHRRIAKGVLLSNLHFMFEDLPEKLRKEMSSFAEQLKRELAKHILTKNFVNDPTALTKIYYSYFPNEGNITFLHEVARIGDQRAIVSLLPHVNPLAVSRKGVTPLECAISEGHAFSLKLLIDFIKKNTRQQNIIGDLSPVIIRYLNYLNNSKSNIQTQSYRQDIFSLIQLVKLSLGDQNKVNEKLGPNKNENNSSFRFFKLAAPALIATAALTVIISKNYDI